MVVEIFENLYYASMHRAFLDAINSLKMLAPQFVLGLFFFCPLPAPSAASPLPEN